MANLYAESVWLGGQFARFEGFYSVARSSESEGCLVAPAVFKTVVGSETGRGMFDSYPLRQLWLHSMYQSRLALPSCGKEVIGVSREQILKLTSLSSCAG
jgi:hypothetical protein